MGGSESVDLSAGSRDDPTDVLGHWTGPGLCVGPPTFNKMGPTAEASSLIELQKLAHSHNQVASAWRRSSRQEQADVVRRVRKIREISTHLPVGSLPQPSPTKYVKQEQDALEAKQRVVKEVQEALAQESA